MSYEHQGLVDAHTASYNKIAALEKRIKALEEAVKVLEGKKK